MMNKILTTKNRLTIHDDPHILRLLISTPFFIAGGYFFYHLLSALHSYIQDANATEWMAALPGMTVMVIFGTLISLPGLFLAARESLVVNKELGVIGKRREMLTLHTRGQITNLVDVGKVICRRTTRKRIERTVGSTSGRSTSVTSYPVDLELKDGQQVALIEFSEKKKKKKIAKILAEFADLPLNDRL